MKFECNIMIVHVKKCTQTLEKSIVCLEQNKMKTNKNRNHKINKKQQQNVDITMSIATLI